MRGLEGNLDRRRVGEVEVGGEKIGLKGNGPVCWIAWKMTWRGGMVGSLLKPRGRRKGKDIGIRVEEKIHHHGVDLKFLDSYV